MLSLVGSIQPDPFSPEHVPKAPVTTATSSSQRTKAPSQPPSAHPSEREVDAMMAEAEAEEDSEDEDLDPFQRLGKLADESERRAREAQEAAAQKEKKRKRKEKEGKGESGAAENAASEKKSKKKKKS